MNSAVLIGSALLIFALGYRFFARFLSILVFKPAYRMFAETNTSKSLSQRLFSVPFNQWLYVANHIAATVGIVSIIGVGIAAIWGWAPAGQKLTVTIEGPGEGEESRKIDFRFRRAE